MQDVKNKFFYSYLNKNKHACYNKDQNMKHLQITVIILHYINPTSDLHISETLEVFLSISKTHFTEL